MHKTTNTLVGRLVDAVDDLSDWPIPEEDAVDLVGTLRNQELRLADLRRRLVSEMDGTEQGDIYEAKEVRSAKRSYNTNGILAAFGPAVEADTVGYTLEHLLLMPDPPVVLAWRWTQLQDAADRYDVTLPVAKHEISDGDPEALVGEVWSRRVDVKPRESK